MLPIRTDASTRERYSQGAGIYRIVPRAVARPGDTAELAAILAWAAERGMPVTPRGAGTAMDGGNVGAGLVLDLTGLGAGPPRIDAQRRIADVGAGVPLAAVNAAASEAGLRFGPDPSSSAWATLGGVIGTNAAGARTFSRGAVDRWVLDIDLVTAEGPLALARDTTAPMTHPAVERVTREVLPLLATHREAITARLPRTAKDTAGYRLGRFLERGSLLDLVIGSEGTLGVITRATVRLEPIPARRAALQLELADRADIPRVVEALRAADPTAVELFDRSFLHLVQGATGGAEPAAVLLVDLEAADDVDLEARLELAEARVAPMVTRATVGRDPAAIAALWELRHAASPILAGLRDGRRSLQVIEDGCVPLRKLPAYLDLVDATCREAEIDAVMFGHAGDGHVHVNLLPDLGQADWLDRVGLIYRRVSDGLLGLGGTPAGEHGAGRLRGALLEQFLGPEAMTVMAAIKRAFDPGGLFNPGVILGADHDPLTRLKVGPDRAPIDAAVERELWRIEAERRWGESRW